MIFNVPLGGSSYISVTAPEGATVSAAHDSSTVSGVGSCTLEVMLLGDWVITCTYDGETKTSAISVASFGQSYSVAFTFFKATLTVTLNAEGSGTVKIKHSVSGTEYTSSTISSGGSYSFTVRESGTWNITGTCNGKTGTSSKSVTTNGSTYTETVTVFWATISVTCKANGNSTVSLTLSGATSPANQTIANNGTGIFTVYAPGNWTVTQSNNSRTATKTASVTTAGADTPVSIEIFYATLNVTPRSIAGASTVVLNGITKSNIADNGTASFVVYDKTSYTATVTSGGQSTSVSISSSGLSTGGSDSVTAVVPYYAYNSGLIAAFSFRKTNNQEYAQSNNSGGSYYMWCKDGGMMYMWQTNAVNFTGYTTLHVRYKLHQNTSGNGYYTDLGIATSSYPGEYNDVTSIHTMHWNSSVYADDNKWVTRTASISYNGNAMFRCRCTGYNAEIYINQIWYT